MTFWYQQSASEVVEHFNVDLDVGLSKDKVNNLRAEHGSNEITFEKMPKWKKFLLQFNDPMVIILLVTAAITGIMSMFGAHMLPDTIVILGVVILNSILGYIQEEKAEGALDALRNMMVHECLVLRETEVHKIISVDLVPGDVVILEGGDKIPADVRFIEASSLYADESSLTGESVPVEKVTNIIDMDKAVPGDQKNIGFSGTFLTQGSAKAVVVETGRNTEFGKIASQVQVTKGQKTPLQHKLGDFINTLIIIILIVGAINFSYGLYLGFDMGYSFLGAVSLIVAAIPEMLPALVTAILALAGTIMAGKKALVRSLPAAETLGAVSVICSDKTGTLTENKMTVTRLFCGGAVFDVEGTGYDIEGSFKHNDVPVQLNDYSSLTQLLSVGFFCNNAHLNNDGGVIGDPTEVALKVSAVKANIAEEASHRLAEIPFDSSYKYMATLTKVNDKKLIFVKGAPENILKMCHKGLDKQGNEIELDEEQALATGKVFAQSALRTLAFAFKLVPNDDVDLKHENLSNMTFAGLQGMIDPPKQSAIEAIEKCDIAGIRTMMITGDHPDTAQAVAKQLGIQAEKVITGKELTDMDDTVLSEVVKTVSVYARVAPEHKRSIAQALQANGLVVAMTGDGVNDAPALKAANIGVAMGVTGTEVAKEASDMILVDDNFSTIVTAVEWGRHVWDSIRRAILYTLPTNAAQALLIMGAILAAAFVPIFAARFVLEPVQILWINLLDSVLYTMPLMMEAKARGLLLVPPRDPNVKIIDKTFIERTILIGLAIFLPAFSLYYHFGSSAVVNGEIVDPLLLTQAQTAAFWAIMFAHVGYLVSARSINRSVFKMNPFSNKWIIIGVSVGVITHLMATYIPGIATFMKLAPFPSEWWPLVLSSFIFPLVIIELLKLKK